MDASKSFNRRSFLQKSFLTGISALISTKFVSAQPQYRPRVITILHTNDVHSRIDPFPMDGTKMQGLGGAARRQTLIKNIRQKAENVLLLDAGDMFQGTPYFNLFDGKLELELMSMMKYDAGTFGNHEFDNGIENLAKQISNASFPFLTSNYDFTGTALEGKTSSHLILEKSGIKIGIFGLCLNLEGMVDKKNYAGMTYLNPLEVALRKTDELKKKHHCDLIICLSHLGYSYENEQISDLVLASKTKDIDLIIGGHTHTFLQRPTEVRNLDGNITLVNQTGKSGVNLGEIEFTFDRNNQVIKHAWKKPCDRSTT